MRNFQKLGKVKFASEQLESSASEDSVPPTDLYGGKTDQKNWLFYPQESCGRTHQVAPLLPAELTGIWSPLCGETQLRMFPFYTWIIN